MLRPRHLTSWRCAISLQHIVPAAHLTSPLPAPATQPCFCVRQQCPCPQERRCLLPCSDPPVARAAHVTSSKPRSSHWSMLGGWEAFCSWWKGSHGWHCSTSSWLPSLMCGWWLELGRKAQKHQQCWPPPNIAYYGENQVLLCFSHSECSFLLLTAGHIPNSHKHVAWIWLCPPEDPPSTIETTQEK